MIANLNGYLKDLMVYILEGEISLREKFIKKVKFYVQSSFILIKIDKKPIAMSLRESGKFGLPIAIGDEWSFIIHPNL